MTQSDLLRLKASVSKLIRVNCRDGESFLGKPLSVSEEDQDLVYDLVATSRQSQYEKADRQPAYMVHFRDIESIEFCEDDRN